MPIASQPTPQDAFSHLLQQPVPALAEQLATETQKFMARQPYDERVGLALFTLAVAHNNQEAWACLYRQYKPLVLTWVTQRPEAAQLIAHERDALVNGAFAKFFQAVTPTKLRNFHSLPALLKYLRLCTHSVLCDEARLNRARACEETLGEIGQEPVEEHHTDDVLATLGAEHLWRLILEELHGDDERNMMYQTYLLGMKPGEVCQHAPHLFQSVGDVYRVKKNVLERLRRSRRLRDEAWT